MNFFTLATFLALAVALVVADVATIRADFKTLDAATSDLNTRLAATNPSYLTALGIHNSALALDKQIKAAVNHTASNTEVVTDAIGKEFVDMLAKTEVTAKSTCDRLIARKPVFDRLGVTGLAKADVQAMAADINALGKALVAAATSAIKPSASTLAAKYNADMQTAKTAYGVV